MNENGEHFFRAERLLNGPWQAFERDVARLLHHCKFSDISIVGGTGDKGADVLARNNLGLWVIQCKHTTTSSPPLSAIDEVVNAGEFYNADVLCIATSRPPSNPFLKRRKMFEQSGLNIRIWAPDELRKLAINISEYPSFQHLLRQYQQEAVEIFSAALIEKGKGQIVLATGLGKTMVMSSCVNYLYKNGYLENNRILVLAHLKDLIRQLHTGFWNQLSKNIPTHQLIQGEMPSFWEGITFATIQSVKNSIAQLPYFDLVLVDEAHHIGAETFRYVIDTLKPKMLGGATATPWRGDNYSIDELLGPPQVRIGIADGLSKGYLTEVDYRLMADNIDWELVQQISENKYSIKQLNKRLIIPTRDEQAALIISHIVSEEKRRAGIIFSPSIEHAKHFSQMLRLNGLSCEIITSNIDAREQSLRISKFRNGKFLLAIVVDMFNEGIDVPDVDLIVFMRVTHSRRIFVQQLGRGLRIKPNKDRVVVLDFVSDLRRVAEIIDLDESVKSMEVEKIGLGNKLVEFADLSSGSFLREWLLDQADLFRNDTAKLDAPEYDYPEPLPGGIE